MNGPIVVLLLVLAVVPLFLLVLWIDARLTERDYQRRIRGDESERYERARQAVARAQLNHPAYKHKARRNPND